MLYYLGAYLAKIKGIKFTKDDAADFLVYAIIGVVTVVSRYPVLGPILFMNCFDILLLQTANFELHGGIIGLAVSTWIFCRKK